MGLADLGVSIIVHYGRSREAAEETADLIRDRGVDVWIKGADLRNPEAAEQMRTAVEAGPGFLNSIVHSAASFRSGTIEDIDAEAWEAIMAVNLRAPYLLTRALRPVLRGAENDRLPGEGPPAAIVHIADLAGLHPWDGYGVHGVSKAGLLHLTRTLARELAPEVRVNAVVPGAILPAPGVAPDSEEWSHWGERLPLQRTGDPSDVLEAIRFLLVSDFVTGAAIPVDGGENLLGLAARKPATAEEGD